MASSSGAIDVCYDYDVFLSFRGDDTRNNFTSHLYEALCGAGIKVFIDNRIDRGEEITATIERVIESAKFSIIVFSPDYASSTFCLDELVKIMECKESKDQIVFPIFYKIEPSEDAYQEAFAKHEAELKRKEETMEQQWKSAFRKALNLGGWPIDDKSVEAELVKEITKEVLKRLNCEPLSQTKGEELMWTSIVGQTAQDILKNIWNCLMHNNISRVGIYGMGGVGKTTIASRINDELLATVNSFTHVFWVTVSKDLSIWKLQNKIAKRINLDLSKEDEKLMRAAKLRKRLRTEKFVLILDDVWEAFEIEDMGIPLVGAQKLLLTTRDRRVCKGMNCQPIKVDPLSQQESLDLFMKEYENEIHDLAKKEILHSIVRECAGLPLAIVVIAKTMRKMEETYEWENVLRKLQKHCEGEKHEMEENVFKPLKVSYDSLPDYQYQQCFLYCSLFPEDHKQSRDTLIEYLIGEGLVGELDSQQAELNLGNAIINGLIDASLLEVIDLSYGTHIKMHDVVRDMAEIVIRENLKAQEGLKLQDLSKETKRCFNLKSVLIVKHSMFESGVLKLAPDAFKLTTLSFDQCFYIWEIPSRFFANMQNLAVLDMTYLEYLEVLPDSISCLKNLRVLLLHYCANLDYIPSLVELKNLRHLDLTETNLKKIPKGMEGLINLRVLKMSPGRSWDAFFPGAFLEKLSHLQILEIQKVEVEAKVVISLEKLETLRIVFYNLESLNSYFKSGHWKRLQKYFIVYLPVTGLIKQWYWREKNEFKTVLCIEKLEDIEGGKRETDMTLPNSIQSLHLVCWNGPMVDVVKNTTFHNLRKLEILSCEDGQPVFTLTLLQGVLHNVEELIIYGGDYVEEIISGEEELVGEINNYYYPTIHLSRLKYLTLRWLRKLRSIYKGRMVCPSLQCIRINRCRRIKRLPFYTEDRNNLNPIQLQLCDMPKKWWDSLHWDDPHAKSFYQVEAKLLYG